MSNKKALLIVDVQNDFCPSGSLPVPEGDQVVPVLNEYIRRFEAANLPIIASRDWHPPKTKHFKEDGGVWPPHCVQGTKGAEFHPDLELPAQAIIVSKGMDPEQDSYSAFQAVDSKGTDLATLLRELGVEQLYAGGLATDYCVKHSVLDGLKAGFKVKLLMDAIRGVEVNPGDSQKALDEMVRAGAEVKKLEEIEEKEI